MIPLSAVDQDNKLHVDSYAADRYRITYISSQLILPSTPARLWPNLYRRAHSIPLCGYVVSAYRADHGLGFLTESPGSTRRSQYYTSNASLATVTVSALLDRRSVGKRFYLDRERVPQQIYLDLEAISISRWIR